MATTKGPARPEILAPAGDAASMDAAVRAGADAVYFGLQGFNARARAKNFDADALAETMAGLHARGVAGYVTLNTLLFDEELASLEAAVRACAEAGVDAVIVQDLGVARLVRAVAPALPLHASTQMTCTDADAVELARSLGATRVILARELSLADLAALRAQTDAELEVFVHGALCVAYSGQCLTSEALGGRSANRGACAQACRLPYTLVVDGEEHPTGDRAYLLSPQDLEASALVPQLISLGIRSLKIEGRLKGPEYVAGTVKLYRAAVDAALGLGAAPEERERERALQSYTRGSGPGFLAGVDHQRLVEGHHCDHRGLQVGECEGAATLRGRTWLRVRASRALRAGDGVLVEGGREGAGEVGGRVWSLAREGKPVERAEAGEEVLLWLGPEVRLEGAQAGRRLFRTNDPSHDKALQEELASQPFRLALDLVVRGELGRPLRLEGRSERGHYAVVEGDAPLVQAERNALDESLLREKLGRLGDTPFVLRGLTAELPAGALVPPSSLNRARRALAEALVRSAQRSWETTPRGAAVLLEAAGPPAREPPPGGLFVLCRTEAQARAALEAGADGVYLDFLELTGTGRVLRSLREGGAACVGVAPPRVRKPGEEKIDQYLDSLAPDAVLVRGLGALYAPRTSALRVGDFSLNVTNRLSAAEVLARGCAAFTPSFDLDAEQLLALLRSPFGPFAELVVHHPMPLFHMEHCVFAALLSEGRDHRSCGRPCERHQLSLRDRAGMEHPVEADVGCRNTVFHAAAQSAAGLLASAQGAGVRRFRVELVRQDAEETARTVQAYRALLAGERDAEAVWRALRAEGRYGVVRGSLRVLHEGP